MRNSKGQFSTPDEKSLSRYQDLHETFCEEYRLRKDPAETTFDTRKRETRYWLAWCEDNDVDPRKANETDIKSYIKSIRHETAGTTISSYLTSIRVFYRELIDSVDTDVLEIEERPDVDIDLRKDYDIGTSTPEYVRIHKVKRKDNIVAIPPEKVEQLFDHVPGENPTTTLRNEVLLKLLWYTACRADELCRMEVDRIDFATHTITIRSSKLNPEDHPDLYIRDVCFPSHFAYKLRRWLEKREVYSSYAENSPYLFVTTHNEQMRPAHVNDIVKQAAKDADIQEPLRPANPRRVPEDVDEWLYTAHRIRRAAISYWVNQCDSIDLHQARRMAGHAQIDRTMEYLEPDKEQLINDYQASF